MALIEEVRDFVKQYDEGLITEEQCVQLIWTYAGYNVAETLARLTAVPRALPAKGGVRTQDLNAVRTERVEIKEDSLKELAELDAEY